MQTANELWQTASINPDRKSQVAMACNRAVSQGRQVFYERVQDVTLVPWQFTAALHMREANSDLSCTIKDGSKLKPGSDWIADAQRVFASEGLSGLKSWTIGEALIRAEKFNGEGYRFKQLNSPYVWAATNHQQAGKYVADGHFDASVTDTQIGVAAMFLHWQQTGELHLDNQQSPAPAVEVQKTASMNAARFEDILDEATQALRMMEWMLPPQLKTAANIFLAIEPEITGALRHIQAEGLDHLKFADLLSTIAGASQQASAALKK